MQGTEKKRQENKPKLRKAWGKYMQRWHGPTGLVRIGRKEAKYLFSIMEDLQKKSYGHVTTAKAFEKVFSNLKEEERSVYEQMEE